MRLICPNCGAQYEVDAKVIPSTGRDVQCSNCGHTWFQRPAEVDSDLADEMGFELTSDDAVSDEPVEAVENEYPTPVAPDVEDDADEPDETIASAVSAAPVPEKPAPVARSAVSESVRDILRAEVAFDQNVKAAEPNALETQTDLGLEDTPTPEQKQGLRERMARLRGLNAAEGVGAATASGRRRDLLPDIEEINSTLSAASERNEDGTVLAPETRKERARRSGFRTTFSALIFIVVILVLLYILAPFLAQKVPALAGVLDAYVSSANAFRAWLDSTITSASGRLNALLGQLNGNS
jgi:predicted Zn finger-like uncharacterized protein